MDENKIIKCRKIVSIEIVEYEDVSSTERLIHEDLSIYETVGILSLCQRKLNLIYLKSTKKIEN